MFNKLHASVKIPNWILAALALLIITIYFVPRTEEANLRPMYDETYHVTDKLAYGPPSTANPYSKHYRFLGHPPGYPISVYLWFKIFPKNYVSGKYHALTFSYLTLILFFLLCWQHMYWLSALTCTLLFANSTVFLHNSVLNLADIPSLLFLFASLYFTSKGRWKTAGLLCLIYVLFRESGVALSVSYIMVALGFALTGKQPDFTSKIPKVALPSLLVLAGFFIGCRIFRGSYLLHPYAHGLLGHTNVTFFSWNEQKMRTYNHLIDTIQVNTPLSMLIAAAAAALFTVVFNQKKYSNLSIFTTASLALTGLFFFVFFTFYGDSIPRDILPTIAAIYFLSFSLISRAFKKWSIIPIVLILSTTSINKPDQDRKITNELLVKVSQYIEANHLDSRICLGWPFSPRLDTIHGYFTHKIPYIHDCKSPEVLFLNSFQLEKARKYRQEIIQRQNMKLTDTIKVDGSKHFFEAYIRDDTTEENW